MSCLENINIESATTLPAPKVIKSEFSASALQSHFISDSRSSLEQILSGKDRRKFFVVGPCSIHNVDEAMEYAERLKKLALEVQDKLILVMRVYFEKPRTTVGWKGLVNDPDLDGSFNVEKGIRSARKFLLDLATMGVPAGTEALDPITPQYLGDLITWTAIGARTAESQTHREMASGLSSPVGIKNGTDGGFAIMVNALKSSAHPHHFLGINQEGRVSTIKTKGNPFGHCILRGGSRPNYDSVSVAMLEDQLRKNKQPCNIVIDCSHANSLKNHELQHLVLKDCLSQISAGNSSIVGFMVESNLEAGNQPIGLDGSNLKRGVSVTDACVGWDTTTAMIFEAAAAV